MELTLLALTELWSQWIAPVLMFVVGLGLVVFVHELGHFLVARWVGIKVERFALGFGPRLFGIRTKETDYCVCAIPLGGYIKMLGQEDFAPLQENEEPDPRSYVGKSIGQRLAVISAGVVMNIIFAAILFVIVGLVGKEFGAPYVGGVRKKYPAGKIQLDWRLADDETGSKTQSATQPTLTTAPQTPHWGAGLKPGDRVLRLDGDEVETFEDVLITAMLADLDDRYSLTVRRVGPDGRAWIGTGQIGVARPSDATTPLFGIAGPSDTVFADPRKAQRIVDFPFQPGDRVVAVSGQPIEHAWEIDELVQLSSGEPLDVTVQRDGERITVMRTPRLISLNDELPDDEKEILSLLGMVPRLEVGSVQADSPADKAGVRPGDIIVGYGDHAAPTLQELRDISKRVAGEETSLIVLRDGRQQTLQVKPKEVRGTVLIGVTSLADQTHQVVAGVKDDSPAANAGVLAGDRIEQVDGQDVDGWAAIYRAVKAADPNAPLTLAVQRTGRTLEIDLPPPSQAGFDEENYVWTLPSTALLRPLRIQIRKTNPLAGIAWGAQETWKVILRTYATLRSVLFTQTVGTETLSGPVGIGNIAIQIGRERPWADFVYLMAIISATVAVINFLPLPVVDGGHATLLLIEKVRGKPLPVKVVNIIQFTGLALLALVFVLLTFQDITKILDRW